MNKTQKYFTLFILAIAMFSCVPQSKIEYLYDLNDGQIKNFELNQTQNNTIKPNDVLLINVSSFDDVSFNYFESQSNGSVMQGANELALSALSYTVNDSGYVRFPIIGKIKFDGLTLEGAAGKLEKTLEPYFNQPNVEIKFAFKKITVLGEVNRPGYHTYTKEKVNIFEAIGIAGDINVHGNIEKVLLLRTKGNKAEVHTVNLTKTETITDDLFYIQPDDVIFVNPRHSITWSVISTPVSLTLTLITTSVLVYNFVEGL